MKWEYITDPNDMSWKKLLGTNGKSKYSKMVGAFDIETSNVVAKSDGEIDNEHSFALPYSFQFGFTTKNGEKIFYLFRKPEEFIHFLKKMNENVGRMVCFFIHNAGYEFEHIKHYLKEIAPLETFEQDDFFFNNSRRKVLYFRVGKLEFRDSYQLEQMSLRKVGENLAEKGVVDILKGDMDYTPIRTPETPLTNSEIDYMLQDVNILCELWKSLLATYKTPAGTPLTNTGKVRLQIKEAMKNYKDVLWAIKAINPSYHAMIVNREAMYGGYTDANYYNYFKVHEDVSCFDIASAHPTAMLTMKFPMGKVSELGPNSFSDDFIPELENLYKTHCFWSRFRFTNLSTTSNHPAIYKSADHNSENAEYRNGKLVSADMLEISLLDRDLFYILKQYDYDSVEIIDTVFISKAGRLPIELRKFIYEQYYKKTAYKNVKGREVEYKLSKVNINSIFGVCAMNPIRDAFTMAFESMEIFKVAPYTGTKYEGLPIDVAYRMKSADKKLEDCYISELWGAYVTMYTRLRVFELIDIVGPRFLYCDTDSVYYTKDGITEDENKRILDAVDSINKRVEKEFKESWEDELIEVTDEYYNPESDEYYNLNTSKILPEELKPPKDPEGVVHPIGIWEFDGHYKKFASRGAKSYLVLKDDGTYKLTHSGLPKKAVSEFQGVDGFKKFLNPSGFTISASTGYHKSKIYQHHPLEGDIVDYLGNEYHYYVPSSLVIYNSEYSTNKLANIFPKGLTFYSANGII